MKEIIKLLRYSFQNITTILKYISSEKYIFIDGFPHTKNFGDALGTPITEFLSDKKVLPSKNISRFLFKIFRFKNYAVIGSILQWAKENSIVWGAGFISEQLDTLYKPQAILAVRGPKTREIFKKRGIECPAVYGDPALLLPLLYYPEIQKKYKIGIIPHYVDHNHPWVLKMKERDDVLFVDLMVYSDYKKIVDQILCCEMIISSSLHGIIVSDAYRIPNAHIQLSEKVVGNNFKFEDYYSSVNRKQRKSLCPDDKNTDYSSMIDEVDIKIDLGKLIQVCPFISKEKEGDLLRQLNSNAKLAHLNAR